MIWIAPIILATSTFALVIAIGIKAITETMKDHHPAV